MPLETVRDSSADDALREALDKVQGTPRLGVIGQPRHATRLPQSRRGSR